MLDALANFNVTEVPSLKTSVREAMSTLNTTTVNWALGLPGMFSTFNAGQLYRIRVVAITASALSIFGGVVGIYCMLNIDKRRKVFRHDLILFLIICDFIKALILMIYPAIILNNNYVYATPAFFNTLGWLTAYATEGADIAIMVFAIHFALLIFKPNWKWRNAKTGNMEGGLYKVRGYIWPMTALIPSVLASLAFINYNKLHKWTQAERDAVVLDNNNYDFPFKPRIGGYKPWSAWCYLPPRPLWYKIVLSWGPRYFLVITIIAIYISIYLYVSSKIRKIKNQLKDFKHEQEEARHEEDRILRSSKFGTIKWLMKRYISPLFMGIIKSFKNFFTLSMEDISDDSELSTRSYSIYSSGSSYAYGANKADNEDYDKYHQGLQILKYKNSKNAQERNAVREQIQNQNQDQVENKAEDKDIEMADLETPKETFNNPLSKLSSLRKHMSIHSTDRRSGHSRRFSDASDESNIDSLLENGLTEIFSTPIPDGEDSETQNPVAYQMEDLSKGISPMDNSVVPPLGDERRIVGANEIDDVKKNFQREMYQNMKKRRSQIQKNVRSIFIYPCSYLALWVFPIIADCLQYNYEEKHGPVMWVTYLDTFTRPLACIVNSMVFFYREKPWRHTWERVEKKVLLDKFILKGEMSEQDMLFYRKTKLGRRGWYYRGKWLKRQCWSHQKEWWKRCLWYVYRTFIGAFKLDFDYEDNCWDNEFWDQYYSGKPLPEFRSHQNAKEGKMRSTETENVLTSDSSLSPSREDAFYDAQDKLKISAFWMLVHLFPMLNGVDLDEINRVLRMKYKEDDFVIPGLTYALTQRNAQVPTPQVAAGKHSRNPSTIRNTNTKLPTFDLRTQQIPSSDEHHYMRETPKIDEHLFSNRNSQVSFARLDTDRPTSTVSESTSKQTTPPASTSVSQPSNHDDDDEHIDILAFLNEPLK